jgi:hypothetical protein
MKTSGEELRTQVFRQRCQKHMMEERQPLQQGLSPRTSINSKSVKDLHIIPETLKLIQEKAGTTLGRIDIGKNFLGRTHAATKKED